MAAIQRPESKFVKVKCEKCRNEQIIFDKAATHVACLVCGSPLAEPSGGMAKVKANIIETLD